MEIRRAAEADHEVLVRCRLRFIAELRGVGIDDLDAAFVEATDAFVADLTKSCRLESWLAVEDGGVIGCVSVVLDDRPPLPEDRRRRDGWVINMFVEPSHRRAGIGRALADAAIAAAPAHGLRALALVTTEDGRPLYASTGFASDPRVLVRPVDQSASSGKTVPAGNRAIER